MPDFNKEQAGSLSTNEVRIINYQQYSISTLTNQYKGKPKGHTEPLFS